VAAGSWQAHGAAQPVINFEDNLDINSGRVLRSSAGCFGFESSEVVPPAGRWSRTVPAGAHPRES